MTAGPIAADPLDLWERLANAPPAARLAAALEGAGIDPAGLALGQGLRRVIAMRQARSRATLEGYAECPACGAGYTIPLDPGAFCQAEVPGDLSTTEIAWQDLTLVLRPLTPADLAAAGAQGDPALAASALRQAAFVSARRDAAPVNPSDLPEAAWSAIEEAIEAADPLADPRIALSCQGCGESWGLALDLPDLMLAELAAEARHSLSETAALARAYGWTEPEIMALSPARRRVYLELAADAASTAPPGPFGQRAGP